MDKPGEPGEGHVFRDFDEAVMAYENKLLGLHAPIKLRVTREIDGEQVTGIIDATLGRLIFNQLASAGSRLCRPQRSRKEARP